METHSIIRTIVVATAVLLSGCAGGPETEVDASAAASTDQKRWPSLEVSSFVPKANPPGWSCGLGSGPDEASAIHSANTALAAALEKAASRYDGFRKDGEPYFAAPWSAPPLVSGAQPPRVSQIKAAQNDVLVTGGFPGDKQDARVELRGMSCTRCQKWHGAEPRRAPVIIRNGIAQ
jgi:hypothetical protein